MGQAVKIVPYDPQWPVQFLALCSFVAPALGSAVLTIEHVGSTAVLGLPAKPIIDMDVVVASAADVPLAIQRLASVGYQHEGDLGIAGREAFIAPEHLPPHHLYVCIINSRELRRHLAFRDYLRSHPDQALLYANLKHELAARCGDNRAASTDGKSEFIQSRLALAGWHP